MDIIDKCIGVFIIAALVPVALGTFHNASTTGFSAAELGLWSLLGILIVIGVVKWVSQ